MKKLIEKLINNKWTYFVIIIMVGLIAGLPLLSVNILSTHDGSIHFLRLLGTVDAIRMGIIPPIVSPSLCSGMGYAINLFYSAFTCYLPLLIRFFTPTYALALKIFGMLCIILSGLTMYKFVHEVTKNKLMSLFSAIIYMIAPYKLANIYVRYAVGEFMATVFIPLLFLGIYNLFNDDGKKDYYIAIGLTGVILSHTISTLYSVIFCLIYVMFFIKKFKEKQVIKKCIINTIFTIFISTMVIFPIIEALNSAEYAIMDDKIMRTNGEYVYTTTLDLSQFIKDNDDVNGTTFVIGMPMIILSIASFYGVFIVNKKYKETYIVFTIFSIFSIIMCTKYFPWVYIPDILCKLQYSWRMLGFFIFFASFLCGVNLQLIIEKISKGLTSQSVFVSVSILIMMICEILTINKFIQRDREIVKEAYKYKSFNAFSSVDDAYEKTSIEDLERKEITHMKINREYLPTKAISLKETYMKEREDKIYILSGNAEIYDEQKNNNILNAEIKNIDENTIIELPYIYYPGYKITIETEAGEIINLKSEESRNGYLSTTLVNIKEGRMKVEYIGTLVTKISYIISAVSFITFITYIFREKKKDKVLT